MMIEHIMKMCLNIYVARSILKEGHGPEDIVLNQ